MLIKSVLLGFGSVKREMKKAHKIGLALLTENIEKQLLQIGSM